MLCGKHAKGGTVQDDYIYVAINMHWEALPFELPALPQGMSWHIFANTSMPSPQDIWEPGSEPEVGNSDLIIGGRSIAILVGR